ncbi:hypothetical protein SRHO_G00142970 [Serrasalmus rhombeus]
MEVLIISVEATSPKQTVYIPCPPLLDSQFLKNPTAMKMQVTLVLIGVFLPEALALTCIQCYDISNCQYQSINNCSGTCGMSVLYTEASVISGSAQCIARDKCVSGNMSTAFTNYTISTGCCDSDNCIANPTAAIGNSSLFISGCASKSFCDKTPFLLSSLLNPNFTVITCCQGNLCNSAGDVMMSLLTMQLFLLSSIFFL